MHRVEFLLRTAAVLTIGLVAGLTPSSAGVGVSLSCGVGMPGTGVEISVTTDRAAYAADEPIAIRLDVTNRTDTVVVFQFSDGQRYDFLIRDEGGETRWRWSADKSFIQVLGEERLAPNDTLSYRERFEDRLPPGTYTVEGTLVATNHPLLARAAITVR